jgi:hypothetical protein
MNSRGVEKVKASFCCQVDERFRMVNLGVSEEMKGIREGHVKVEVS